MTIVTGCPAAAQQITTVVRYHELDLTTCCGAGTLRHRLRHAVNYACRFQHARDDMLKSENQECREEVAAAVNPRMARAIELAEERAAATEFASR